MDWITLINALTVTEMSVPESRLDEYLKAGHKLANPTPVPDIVGGKAPDPGHSPGLPSGQRPEPAKAEPPKPAEPAPKATPKRKTKPKAKA